MVSRGCWGRGREFLGGGESSFKIVPEVVEVFAADAEAQQPGRDAVTLPARTALENGLHAAEARCVRDLPQ